MVICNFVFRLLGLRDEERFGQHRSFSTFRWRNRRYFGYGVVLSTNLPNQYDLYFRNDDSFGYYVNYDFKGKQKINIKRYKKTKKLEEKSSSFFYDNEINLY